MNLKVIAQIVLGVPCASQITRDGMWLKVSSEQLAAGPSMLKMTEIDGVLAQNFLQSQV